MFLIEVHDAEGRVISSGTGFAVTADGLVATNYHVVDEGHTFSAKTEQGSKFSDGRIVKFDTRSDLALLQFEGKNLPFLPLGKSEDVAVGTRVAVYGCPRGLAGTLSDGIVSAKRNEMGEGIPNNGDVLQTTAPISPGSSGSPLLDANGNVLGVITMGSTGSSQNLNFAVPVEALRTLKEAPQSQAFVPGTRDDSTLPESKATGPNSAFFADPAFMQLRASVSAKDSVSAMKSARDLAQKHPKSPAAHYHLAKAAESLQLDQEAENSYQKSLALDPEFYPAWNGLGNLAVQRKEFRRALPHFERAAAIRPDHRLAWVNIVYTGICVQDWEKSATALETLCSVDSEEAWTVAEKISKYRFPNRRLKEAVATVLAHREDNSAYPKAASGHVEGGKYFVFGVPDGDTLTVRSGPGADYAKVTSLANGTTDIEVTGSKRMNGNTEWLPVVLNGKRGWVRGKYLKRMLAE